MKPAAGQATAVLNGREVRVEWTRAAAAGLAGRTDPLVVEVELYFSCLVKKFVRFHEQFAQGQAGDRELAIVNDKLSLCFRPVMSTPCSMDLAERLGRQPEVDIPGDAVKKIAPRRVRIDRRANGWAGEAWF